MISKDKILQIEKIVKTYTKNSSPIHGFEHLQRTAIGAGWFAKIFKANQEDQNIAHIAGLIHDLKRPSTEKIDHTGISISEARNLLQNIDIHTKFKKIILNLIAIHREFTQTPLKEQVVFLADKLLEQSGAYLLFRRSYYIGECEDLINIPFEKATDLYWRKRMTKFSPEKFDKAVKKLAFYQYKWQLIFLKKFNLKDESIYDVVQTFYNYGRQRKTNLTRLIQNYKPHDKLVKEFKKETLKYLEGKKYKDFQQMIKL